MQQPVPKFCLYKNILIIAIFLTAQTNTFLHCLPTLPIMKTIFFCLSPGTMSTPFVNYSAGLLPNYTPLSWAL